MPAAQDKSCISYCKECGVCLMFSCIVFYVTGSWHGDLRCYKHKNLLVIFLFTCKVASHSPAVTSLISSAQSVIKEGCGTGHYIELHVWSSHQHERAQ